MTAEHRVACISSGGAVALAWLLLFSAGGPLATVSARTGIHTHGSTGRVSFQEGTAGTHGDPEARAAESGWRRCRKCKGVFFASRGSGVCPVDGRAHDGSTSAQYAIADNAARYPGQKGWRRCARCQGLVFAGNESKGVCPVDAGPHDVTDSPEYVVPSSSVQELARYHVPGQDRWAWCHRCQALFFNGITGLGESACPAGAAHEAAGSRYALEYDAAGSSAPVDAVLKLVLLRADSNADWLGGDEVYLLVSGRRSPNAVLTRKEPQSQDYWRMGTGSAVQNVDLWAGQLAASEAVELMLLVVDRDYRGNEQDALAVASESARQIDLRDLLLGAPGSPTTLREGYMGKVDELLGYVNIRLQNFGGRVSADFSAPRDVQDNGFQDEQERRRQLWLTGGGSRYRVDLEVQQR